MRRIANFLSCLFGGGRVGGRVDDVREHGTNLDTGHPRRSRSISTQEAQELMFLGRSTLQNANLSEQTVRTKGSGSRGSEGVRPDVLEFSHFSAG